MFNNQTSIFEDGSYNVGGMVPTNAWFEEQGFLPYYDLTETDSCLQKNIMQY